MAVAWDSGSESHTGTTPSTSQASFTWNHTPVGTPRAVVVFVFNTNANANDATSVTYGGTNLAAVSGGVAADTATEPGRCQAWFVTASNLPTGLQAVVVNRNNNANEMYAVVCVFTAATDCQVRGIILLQENGTCAEQSVTDNSTGTNSVRVAGLFSGLGSAPGTGASSTAVASIVIGAARSAAVVRETTAGQGSRSIGFSTSTDDRAAVHFAVSEIQALTLSTTDTATGAANSPVLAAATMRSLTDTGTAADIKPQYEAGQTSTEPGLTVAELLTALLTTSGNLSVSTSDLVIGTDTPSSLTAIGLTLTDGMGTADPFGPLGKGQLLADAATVGQEVITLVAGIARSLLDSAVAADNLVTAVAILESLQDAGVASDQVTTLLAIMRVITDQATVTDSVSGQTTAGGALTQTLTDLLTAGDQVVSLLAILRTVTDQATATDSVTGQISNAGALTQTITDLLLAADQRQIELGQTYTEPAITVHDAVAAVLAAPGLTRLLTDTVTAGQALSTLLTTAIAVAALDTATAAETLTLGQDVYYDEPFVTATDVLSIGQESQVHEPPITVQDLLASLITISRSLQDNAAAADVVTALLQGGGSIAALVTETPTVADALATLLAHLRTLTDQATVGDTVATSLAFPSQLLDTATITDLVTAAGAILLALSEPAVASDVVTTLLAHFQALTDGATVMDVVTVLLGSQTIGLIVHNTSGVRYQVAVHGSARYRVANRSDARYLVLKEAA